MENWAAAYRAVRALTNRLGSYLETEDFVAQPMADVSPPKWHFGHTTWFFETFVLVPHLAGYRPFHELYSFLFNSYYNHIGSRVARGNRGSMTRPTVREIMDYRSHVDMAMEQLMCQEPNPALLDLIEIGLHHEQQHQELLLYDIKYILGHNLLYPALFEPPSGNRQKTPPQKAKAQEWLAMPEGLYTIGHQASGFSFDNEAPLHKHYLTAFALADRLVTNAEYLAFMEDKGYARFELFLDEGWAYVQALERPCPEYWVEKDGQWMEYTLHGLAPLDLQAPLCHVSYYEADAFANWSGYRLPSEQEWEACAKAFPQLNGEGSFFGGDRCHPQVEQKPSLVGNLWQWTKSPYSPYPGFRAAKGAIGEYNGKFMVNQMVARGGSVATPEGHHRVSYRNFFHPDKRWLFSGIRLAKDL